MNEATSQTVQHEGFPATTNLCIAVETEMSIFCEVMYQRHITDDYKGLFNFPLSLYEGHKLHLSIGHCVHGRARTTGRPGHPTDLSQRNADPLFQYNIVIEP